MMSESSSTSTPTCPEDAKQDDAISSTDMLSGDQDASKLSGKNCVVCADRALSCNFGAITCESCKAFFRRNAHKEMWGKCDGKCPITVETRSYCKKCRLEKCFTVGMKKDLILSDHQKQERRQKIMENRLRRQGLSLVGTPTTAYSGRPDSPDAIDPRVGYVTRHYVDPSSGVVIRSEAEGGAGGATSVLHGVRPEPGQEPGEVVLGPIHSNIRTRQLSLSQSPPIISPRGDGDNYTHSSAQDHLHSSKTLSNVHKDHSRLSVTSLSEAMPHKKNYSDLESFRSESYESSSCNSEGPNIMKEKSSASFGINEAQTQHHQDSRDLTFAQTTQQSNYSDYKEVIFNAAFQGIPMPLKVSETKKIGLQKNSTLSVAHSEVNEINEEVVRSKNEYQEECKEEPVDYSPSTSSTSPSTTYTHALSGVNIDDLVPYLDKEKYDLLKEIKAAFAHSFDEPVADPINPAPTFTDFFNLAELPIKRLVKMAKYLRLFRSLNQDDQVALLKGSVVAMVTIRSAKLFNPSTCSWNVVRAGKEVNLSSMSLQMTNQPGMKLFQLYKEFSKNLVMVSHGDDGIMMMLIVLAVFDPVLDGIQVVSKVKSIRKKYMELLEDYVHIKYPDDKDMFGKVLDQLDRVNEIRNSHGEAMLRLPPNELQPLIYEIFDMSKYSGSDN